MYSPKDKANAGADSQVDLASAEPALPRMEHHQGCLPACTRGARVCAMGGSGSECAPEAVGSGRDGSVRRAELQEGGPDRSVPTRCCRRSLPPTREAALAAPEAQQLVGQGHDKLACVRAQGPGFLLLDGANGGPPFVQLCNDPRGTALQPNAQLTDAGYLRVTQTRVRPFDTSKYLDENIHSELRISYGSAYWKHFGA
eukprot:476813-Prymnesium_polylepis.2